MIKKIIFCFFILFGIRTNIVNASANSLVRIGNNYYDTLKEVTGDNIIKDNNDTIGKILFFIPILVILIISVYASRKKLLNLIKK